MIRTVAAATFALLTFVAPAHAALVEWQLSDVTGTPPSVTDPPPLTGVTVTGFFDYNTVGPSSPASYTNYSFSVASANACCNFTLADWKHQHLNQ